MFTTPLTACLALLLAAVMPGAALAQESPQNQRFELVATDPGGTYRVVAAGPIRGVGTGTTYEHTANPDGTFTDADRFDLPGGQVFLTDTYTVQITSEPRSCTSNISVAGTYAITGATATYAGAQGEGTFTASGVFVAGRDSTGACLGFDSTPVAFSEQVHLIGTTTLPSGAQ